MIMVKILFPVSPKTLIMEILVDFIHVNGWKFKPNAVVQKSIVYDSVKVLDYSMWLDNPAILWSSTTPVH